MIRLPVEPSYHTQEVQDDVKVLAKQETTIWQSQGIAIQVKHEILILAVQYSKLLLSNTFNLVGSTMNMVEDAQPTTQCFSSLPASHLVCKKHSVRASIFLNTSLCYV
jgi:hypothetical protein